MKWNRVPYGSAVTRYCIPLVALDDISSYFTKILGSQQQFTDFVEGTWFHEDGTKVLWQISRDFSCGMRPEDNAVGAPMR